MYARTLFFGSLLLLGSLSCVIGAEEGLAFPNYLQASRTLPGEITVPPVFSGAGNYGIVAAGDTLYHLELVHGRVHGTTPLSGGVNGLEVSASGTVFASAAGSLWRIEGFQVTESVQLEAQCALLTSCGEHPVILTEAGTLERRDPQDLSLLEETVPVIDNVVAIQGFQGSLCLAGSDGSLVTLSVPGMKETARDSVNGSIVFMNGAGTDRILFSTTDWNEVAVCSIHDLIIQQMYTFPGTPLFASADSTVGYIFATCPEDGVQVCTSSGEIAWRNGNYGPDALHTVADDCETAMITFGSKVDILVK